MGWRGVFYSLFFLMAIAALSSRSGKMWLPNLGAESAVAFSWPILSASIFVFVALVLSMYLTFEHLAAYNQPEEQKFLIGLILMVPVYALESIVDDMKYTVSHLVEPVERGIAKINRTFHQISENVRCYEEQKRKSKDDSYLIPLNSWTIEFSEVHDNLPEGSFSDSGLPNGKKQHQHYQSEASGPWIRTELGRPRLDNF